MTGGVINRFQHDRLVIPAVIIEQPETERNTAKERMSKGGGRGGGEEEINRKKRKKA